MNYIFHTLLVILIVTNAQQDDDFQVIDSNQYQQHQQQYPQNVQFGQQSIPNEEQQRYLSMRRTACLVLSRYHSNANVDTIQQILKKLPVQKQQEYINKMYSVAVEQCQKFLAPEDVQQFYVESANFNPQLLFYVFNDFSYQSLQNNFKLTENQKIILKYIKQYDAEMEIKREQKKAEEEKLQAEQSEVKIFWMSLRDFGIKAEIIYILIVAALVIGFVVWVLNQLKEAAPNKNKKKKQKKSQ